MSIADFIILGGKRFPVQLEGVTRGFATPLIPRFGVGDRAFTGGIPPFDVQGQRFWQEGIGRKYARRDDERAFRRSTDISAEWGDRVVLATSFASSTDMGGDYSIKFARYPFKDVLVCYATDANKVWTIGSTGTVTDVTASNHKILVDGSAAPTGTRAWGTAGDWGDNVLPTGWLSSGRGNYWDRSGANPKQVSVLLLGSDKGHLMAYDGTDWFEIVHGGTELRPVNATDSTIDLVGGIFCIATYRGVTWLGGKNTAGNGALCTWGNTDKSNTFQLIQKDTQGALDGGAVVRTLTYRYVDGDQNPEQLHITIDQNSATGAQGWHIMYDGDKLRSLRRWPDNYPLDAIEVDVVGARGLFFAMARFGSVWRYTGDYQEVLRIDTPDEAYQVNMSQLGQYGRFLVAGRQRSASAWSDITSHGGSLLYYSGQGWWEASGLGSGAQGAGTITGIAAHRSRLYVATNPSSGNSTIRALNTEGTYQTGGVIETALYDGGFPEVPKKWFRARVAHNPLAASETVKIDYLADDSSGTLGFTENFDTATYKDGDNTTADWNAGAGVLQVTGMAAKTIATTESPRNYAYQGPDASPTTKTPAQLIAQFTEFTAQQYTDAGTDDAATAATGSTVGTLGENATTETSGFFSSGTGQWAGQTFAGSAATLSAVIAKLLVGSGGSATVVAHLYATSGGLPTGAALSTSDAVSVTATSATEHTFSFASPYTMSASTTYVVVFEVTAVVGTLTFKASTTSSYASGTVVYTVDAGVSWASGSYDLYFKIYTGGTFGKACQLIAFDTGGAALNTIPFSAIAYGADTTGAANKGVTAYLWNDQAAAWASVWTSGTSTHSAGSGDTDAAKTLNPIMSASVANYVNAANKIYVLLVSTYAGVNTLASRVTSDLLSLAGSYSTSALIGQSLTVDAASQNITSVTFTVTHTLASATGTIKWSPDGGANWDTGTALSGTSTTATVNLAAVAAGSALRWKITLTAASATAKWSVESITASYVFATPWVTLGTNSTLGTTVTEYAIGSATSPVIAKYLALRVTLAGSGSTTPQVFRAMVEMLYAPTKRETFGTVLRLEEGYRYSDGQVEARTPATMYTDLSAMLNSQTPALTWVDGTVKSSVEFTLGYWQLKQRGLGTERSDEEYRLVPIQLVTVID